MPTSAKLMFILVYFLVFHTVAIIIPTGHQNHDPNTLFEFSIMLDKWIISDTKYCRMPRSQIWDAAERNLDPTPDWITYYYVKINSYGKYCTT